MASEKYWEKIAKSVAEVVYERQIENVLHFTRFENLAGILKHGLHPRSSLAQADYAVYASSSDRLDKDPEAVSVSISCYYPKMFEKKRHGAGDQPWAVLILHPSVLWSHHCLFYRQGVSTKATMYERHTRYGGWALRKLFEDCRFSSDPDKMSLRDMAKLPQSWPTFSDAEVQVKDSIDPRYITGVWVETRDQEEKVLEALKNAGRHDCETTVLPFEPRIVCKPYFWG